MKMWIEFYEKYKDSKVITEEIIEDFSKVSDIFLNIFSKESLIYELKITKIDTNMFLHLRTLEDFYFEFINLLSVYNNEMDMRRFMELNILLKGSYDMLLRVPR